MATAFAMDSRVHSALVVVYSHTDMHAFIKVVNRAYYLLQNSVNSRWWRWVPSPTRLSPPKGAAPTEQTALLAPPSIRGNLRVSCLPYPTRTGSTTNYRWTSSIKNKIKITQRHHHHHRRRRRYGRGLTIYGHPHSSTSFRSLCP